MTKYLVFGLILILLFSCEVNRSKSVIDIPLEIPSKTNDSIWVKNTSYNYGDIRRYGFQDKHLLKEQIDSIIDIGSSGVDISFPKGLYPINFVLENKKNLNIHFNSSIIAGKLSIVNTNNVNITGEIEILDQLFLKNSSNISFNEVSLRTDKINNLHKRANRGVNIYSGSKDITMNELSIEESGGDDVFFQYSQAALMIHGFQDTPKRVIIKHILIKNSKRTGAYISGSSHYIGKIKVNNYGLSKNKDNIKPVEKASIGEEKIFSGVWMNRSENNRIDTLVINNQMGYGTYSIILDESQGYVPNLIGEISITDGNDYTVDLNSNTLVMHEF
ncbi:hypothetical protein R3X28_01775 [Maribacter sp. TH_r10]|uniref:hypothetical protein n=1 Tax=Maribacter sp. TH_r10 TaxID=3082086 RepID=UPI002954EF77|nr:hypothetical protein [Maribacter sp. TH_r10]MDV7137582.1 hypothetical protein [Maribacter sp. TH_r10]